MLDTVAQRNALLTSIERARNSSVIAYMLHDSAVIADDAVTQLYDKLQALGRRERIDLLLYARGGVTEVCWRVLNLLRDYCDHLGLIVGTRAYGAAALLALGADEIVMGPLSELSGVEAPRKHPLLPRDDSGQPIPVTWSEVKGLGGLGIRDWGLEGKEQDASNPQSLPPNPYPYIHPLVIAHLQQADAMSRDVTRKALRSHMHPDDENRIERIVEAFNGGFHSPIYTASRAELMEMGLPVIEASEELWSNVLGLVQHYQTAIYNDRPDPTTHGAFFRYVCVIESIGRSTGLRQTFSQSEGQERILQMRWETAIKGPGPGPSIGPGGMSNN